MFPFRSIAAALGRQPGRHRMTRETRRRAETAVADTGPLPKLVTAASPSRPVFDRHGTRHA